MRLRGDINKVCCILSNKQIFPSLSFSEIFFKLNKSFYNCFLKIFIYFLSMYNWINLCKPLVLLVIALNLSISIWESDECFLQFWFTTTPNMWKSSQNTIIPCTRHHSKSLNVSKCVAAKLWKKSHATPTWQQQSTKTESNSLLIMEKHYGPERKKLEFLVTFLYIA